MQTSYAFSQTVLPTGSPTTVDLLLRFRADEGSAPPRRPLNISIVIDRSASMAGNPLQYAKQAAVALVDQLTADDMVSVVMYDDDVDTVLPPTLVTDKAAIRNAIQRIRPGGCTNLSGGWLQGCDHVKANLSEERISRVLLLTDGQANAGIRDANTLIAAARQKTEEGIITTTLGFGSGFNEDLLIGMARAAGGNFYYIQSPDEAAEVFGIELQSLTAIAATDLLTTVETVAPGVTIAKVLSGYRQEGQTSPNSVTLAMGDVYANEAKLLALTLNVPAPSAVGTLDLVKVLYTYETAKADGGVETGDGDLTIPATIGTLDDVLRAQPATDVMIEISRIRIATAKDEAIALSDAGNGAEAAKKLRDVIEELKKQGLDERFEVAEEIEQLVFFAERIESRGLDSVSRKEMRDQSFQGATRARADLSARGASSGSAASLPTVSDVGDGVELLCFREGGKLRIKVVTGGYDQTLNVQFPRAIRDEGIHYVAEGLELSADGSFYRAKGDIKRLVRPGETDPYLYRSSAPRTPKTGKASTGPASAADLETCDTVGDGVLVQCVKAGSKLRARVVSDGYEPDWNMRFPRSVREEGMLYVVDEVITGPDGASYIACGKVKRFVQAP
jgi:Ca-activated chloride channel family protein